MSANIFEERNYNAYLIEQYLNKSESNELMLKEWTDDIGKNIDSYPKLPYNEAMDVLDKIYTSNSYLLYKEYWPKLLLKRLVKDLKRGFVVMIDIQPSMFQKVIKTLYPVLKLFSGFNKIKQILDNSDAFYETSIAGCYSARVNKMIIVSKYIDKSNINLDLFKTVLHEYCHFYARKKHDMYISLFEGMVRKFYIGLINAIAEVFKLKIEEPVRKKLLESIMKWNFYKLDNFRNKTSNFSKCVDEMDEIHHDFAEIYTNMLLSRLRYEKDSNLFINSIECIRRAYLNISDEVTSGHIARFDYSYQEYYCADEIVAVMSFYKPNYKPYLQMLESLV